MKLVKPSKQTMLKGLLLLVVGLNFSWRPLLSESHQTNMASELLDAKATAVTARKAVVAKPAPAAAKLTVNNRQLSGPEMGKANETDPNDPSTQYVKVCDGKFVTLKKDLDGSLKLVATDADRNILNCETCMNSDIHQSSPGPLQADVVMALKDGLKLSCDSILTDKEKEALAAKQKQAEEDKAELAEKIVSCETDKKGDALDAQKKLDCEVKHLNMSDKEMKKAGIDKDRAKEIREDLAKNALKDAKTELAADAKACKRSHKEDDNYDDCDNVLEKYDDIFSKFADSNSKILQAGSKSLTTKLEKFETFVKEEKKSDARVSYFNTQYDQVNTAMEKTYDQYSTRCDGLAATYGNAGQNFDSDACKAAYVKQYLLPTYEPKLKQLKAQFTTEENKYYREFDADKKVDLIGEDGKAAALAPWHDYTKELSSYGATYSIPQNDLPQFADNAVVPGASIAANIGLDSGRFGALAGARQFTPLTAIAGVNGASSQFAVPQVLSGNASTARYNSALPTSNLRQRSVTAGVLLPTYQVVNSFE